NAAAGTPQRERRADDHGETDFGRKLEAVFQIVDQRGFGDVEADAGHRVLEEEAVFGFLDGADVRADELHFVFFENAGVGEFDREVQSRLAADGGQQRKPAPGAQFRLDPQNFFEVRTGERLDVSAVGDLGIG